MSQSHKNNYPKVMAFCDKLKFILDNYFQGWDKKREDGERKNSPLGVWFTTLKSWVKGQNPREDSWNNFCEKLRNSGKVPINEIEQLDNLLATVH